MTENKDNSITSAYKTGDNKTKNNVSMRRQNSSAMKAEGCRMKERR
ncbi:MAG: hypothetical protein K6B18_07120 [Ruminococcus sp.]|nr:hypothetical protein [Ruminococcus sp.]